MRAAEKGARSPWRPFSKPFCLPKPYAKALPVLQPEGPNSGTRTTGSAAPGALVTFFFASCLVRPRCLQKERAHNSLPSSAKSLFALPERQNASHPEARPTFHHSNAGNSFSRLRRPGSASPPADPRMRFPAEFCAVCRRDRDHTYTRNSSPGSARYSQGRT